MTEATLKVKNKIEQELKEAERKMNLWELRWEMDGGQLQYNYWKKEVISLRKELKDIIKGYVIY